MTLTMPAADFVRGVTSVLACASGDRTLPSLNAVRIEWDGEAVVFAATDRYVLGEQTIALPDAERICGGVTVPLEIVKSVLVVLKATAPRVNLADDRTVSIAKDEVHGQKFDPNSMGDYPKWRSLMPHESTEVEIGRVLFDPDKLAQLAGPKVKGRRADLECRFTGQVKPIAVTRVGDDTFRGLLMPIRPSAG